MRTRGRNLGPQRGRLGNGDDDSLDGNEIKIGEGLWATLEPIERNSVLISAGQELHIRRRGEARGPQVRMGYVPYVGFGKVSSIFVPVEMEERREENRWYEREQNRDADIPTH